MSEEVSDEAPSVLAPSSPTRSLPHASSPPTSPETHASQHPGIYRSGKLYKAAGIVPLALVSVAGEPPVPSVLLIKEERAKEKATASAPTLISAPPHLSSAFLMAFPGGKIDAKDRQDPIATALREFHEETGSLFSRHAGPPTPPPLDLISRR